jgi:hypothetical protein
MSSEQRENGSSSSHISLVGQHVRMRRSHKHIITKIRTEREWLLLISHFSCWATCENEEEPQAKQNREKKRGRMTPPLLPWWTNNHGRRGGAKWLT